MSDPIPVFQESPRHPKNYHALRLLYEIHVKLGHRVSKYVFMPQSMAHVLRQTCKIYNAIFDLIEKVTHGQDVNESHRRYTGAIKPLEEYVFLFFFHLNLVQLVENETCSILLALLNDIRNVPQKRMNERVVETCTSTGVSISSAIMEIAGKLETVKSLMVETLQKLSQHEGLKVSTLTSTSYMEYTN